MVTRQKNIRKSNVACFFSTYNSMVVVCIDFALDYLTLSPCNSQPHAPVHIGKQQYSYDANGNQTGWTHDVSGQRRQIIWDEENRIRAIADNGSAHHYIYDASGTRVLKGKSNGQSIRVNGEWKAGSGNMGNYTVYVNPYLVLRSGGYTKHYYIEGQRIVSKLGSGLNNKGKGPLKAGREKVNYSKKQQDSREGIVKNLKWLGQDGQLLTAGNSGKTPPGQLKKVKGSDGSGDGKGKDKGGKDKDAEKFQYYYHPDHLGSTSYITDASGEVYQHLEYFAFGETFVEEHSNRKHTPYKFNGKELDEETRLYYYGARYYDAKISIFYGVDPKAEVYTSWSPYVYAANNPIRYEDTNGQGPGDRVLGFAAAMVDNAFGGFTNVRSVAASYVGPDGAADFNMGQDMGDVSSMAIGAMMIESGGGAAAGGVVVSATVVGAPVAVTGVVVAAEGTILAVSGAKNLVDQKGRLNVEGQNNQGSGTGRGKNKRQPDQEATGDHTVSNDRGSTTFQRNDRNPSGFQEVKRVDKTGASHGGIETPHVHESGKVRPAQPNEIPKTNLSNNNQ